MTILLNFVIFVLLPEIVCAACANSSMSQDKKAGFKPAPTPDSFLRPLRSLRPFFFSVAALRR